MRNQATGGSEGAAMTAEPAMGGGTPDTDPVPGADSVLESVLESVVVHSLGAVCVRRARCALPPGLAASRGAVRIRVEGLPVTAAEHSLRGRAVCGPPGLRVTDIRLTRTAAHRPEGEPAGLRAELTAAEDRLAGLRGRHDRLTAEIEEVARLRAVPPQPRRGDPPRRAPVESLLALAGFLDARLAGLHERLRTVSEELRAAEHETDVLAHRLAAASGALPDARAGESAAAVLTLDRAGDGTPPGESGGTAGGAEAGSGETGCREAEFEIEYHVPGATWSPVYQLRLDGTGAGAAGTLVLRACVAQRTGEDWTGVRLGLSTADLLRRADVPRLRSLRLGRRQAEEPSAPGWREPPPGLDELFAGYDAAVAAASPARPPVAAAAARQYGARTAASVRAGAAPSAIPAPMPAMPAPPPPAPGGAEAAGPFAEHGGPPVAGGAAPAAFRAPGGGPPPGEAAASTASAAPTAYGPPRPAGELLDYSRLTLAGPDEPGRRGRLRPAPEKPGAAVAERRRQAEAVARLPRPAHATDVRISAGSFHHRYDTAAPVDVAADGAWHTVPVCELPAETVPEYVCVPSVDQTVYGTVLLTNTSHHALLAGPADITVDGDHVRTAPLPTLAPGECRRVGVGAAEGVRVARRVRTHESTAGLRGGTTVLDHTVEVELANRLAHRVTVEVRERVPVPDDRDVRVEERPAEPAWRVHDEPFDDGGHVRGARVWRVELEPGRTTVLRGGYEIRVPAGKALVGGSRRDRTT
ncbi:DUF4139 domain-containing protein [Streptomyces sp. TRM 70361]|uniref:DUF4139 domain-containing protein n=1 Tax=Streptomyces sp. TRM 70361 TaxID=3116553 RepID=UPI002E7AD60F|nr:DUF4139 domain-containing protein [Streptomyces sp. TRM 70361]MEE1941349.1 DUF4139 domain-containing protein [Streptomyces sp. TRM 70361]